MKKHLYLVTAVLTSMSVVALAPAAQAASVTVAAAGDIACSPLDGSYNGGQGKGTAAAAKCKQLATSQLIVDRNPAAVFTLGDNQYPSCQNATTGESYLTSYDSSWGRFLATTYPAYGDQDYITPNACDAYFANSAHNMAASRYYSLDIGDWHVVVLDTGMSGKIPTAEKTWLQNDLAGDNHLCEFAVMHNPRWTSGMQGPSSRVGALFSTLVSNGVEFVMGGNTHIYERLAPVDAAGNPSASGTRQWVVGTGGKNQAKVSGTPLSFSEVIRRELGVLFLTLNPSDYSWQFVGINSGVADGGSGSCHAPGQSAAPTITSFTPANGPEGTAVTITGTDFTGATAVTFNGTPATTFSVTNATTITATVPAGATTGPIAVTTPGGTATSSSSFTVDPPPPVAPTISGFTPDTGPVGSGVTITGANFIGVTDVSVGGVAAAFTVDSDGQITATVPAGAITGPIAVTGPGGTVTSTSSFTVTA